MNRLSLVSLAVAIALLLVACAIPSEAGRSAPNINSISPSSIPAGSGGFILAVEGSNFSPSSVVFWNGNARATTFINKTRLLAAILSTDVAQAGNAQITVMGKTPNSEASSPFAMTIGPVAPLAIATNSLPDGTVQAPYNANVTNKGGIAPYKWRVASGQLPPGVALNSSNGVLSGVPGEKGSYGFAVEVSDSSLPEPQSASKTLNLNVTASSPALQVSTTSLPGGQIQVAYTAALAATGGTQPYTWSLASGSLPLGLSLNSSGAIAGTPSQGGGYSFTVRASDAAGQSAQQSLSINIATAAGGTPVINGLSPISGPVSGGTSVTITGANFQAGARVYIGELDGSNSTVSSSTQISFVTPAHSAGTYGVTVANPDATEASLPAAFTYISSLQITTTSLPGGQVGGAYQAVVAAGGGTQPYAWSLASGALPPGLTLSASTGQISGSPTQSGNFSFVAHVSDASGSSSQQSLSINIGPAGSQPLSITTASLPPAQVNQAYSATLQATGGTGIYNWGVSSGQLPPGLSLGAASGQFTGTTSAAGQFGFTVQVTDSGSPAQSASKSFTLTVSTLPALDRYGGIIAAPSPNGATGQWRLEKFGNGWMFVTPDGNAFWSFGVFNIVPDEHVDDLGDTQKNRVTAKYGDSDKTWGPQQVRRLRSWGFNTVLDHSSVWVHPVKYYDGWPGDRTQPEKMPGVWFVDAGGYALRNVFGYAPQGAKDIFNGVNTTYYNGYVAPNADPFDPNFAVWVNTYLKSGEAATAGNSPWVIGFSLAESDYIWGFGAGSSTDFATVPPGHNSPHIAWVVLVTSPTQTSNSRWGANYADSTVYAKQALKTFLQSRYGTIAALDAAWGSNYTTFDSAGGWGGGTGLLDEDGRHSWIPNWDTLAGATSAMRQDLDDFLFLYAEKWFKTQRDAVKINFPSKLYFGPNVVGSWGTPPRRQVLKAAGLYIDVLMTQLGLGSPDDQQRLDFTMQHLGDKPIVPWIGFPANADSALWRYADPPTFLVSSTQGARGQIYAQVVNSLWNAAVSSSVPGVGGTKPFVGLRWWAWTDAPHEKTNWGLISTSDNAYDGKEAVVSRGIDPWGYVTGGEEKNYGDFLTPVRSSNLAVIQSMAAQPRR